MIRVLITDDEGPARQVLREELELISDVNIVGEAADGQQALRLIEEQQPDLVFLDIQMPVLSGFEVISRLTLVRLPVIVMVTAFDQCALQAFEAGAVDYLLKPVSQERLFRSLDRARQLLPNRLQVAESVARLQQVAAPAAPPALRRLLGRVAEEYFLLDPAEILALQADGELVWIITAKQRFLATQSLKLLEERIEGSDFVRVHRNAIVNVNHIRKMAILSNQRWLVTLANNDELIVSRREARRFREILGW